MTILKLTNISKSYLKGKKKVDAVRNVSISLNSGEVLALLGLNGAGKTTLIKMIANLIDPDAGTIEMADANKGTTTNLAAVLEGNRNLYGRLTALENLEYYGVLRGMKPRDARTKAAELLTRFGLIEKKNERAQRFSRGMQQRLAIACSLVHQPRLLLLDEPTLGVDYQNNEAIKELVGEIKKEGCAILLTTHQLDFAESVSDRVAIIQGGELVADEAIGDLMGRFAVEDTYQIDLASPVPDKLVPKLIKLGADVREKHVYYRGLMNIVYEILQVLKPLELVRVFKTTPNFQETVMKFSQEGA